MGGDTVAVPSVEISLPQGALAASLLDIGKNSQMVTSGFFFLIKFQYSNLFFFLLYHLISHNMINSLKFG